MPESVAVLVFGLVVHLVRLSVQKLAESLANGAVKPSTNLLKAGNLKSHLNHSGVWLTWVGQLTQCGMASRVQLAKLSNGLRITGEKLVAS